jgi:hypothetical protein
MAKAWRMSGRESMGRSTIRMYWILFGAISKANTQANSATYGEIP